MRIDALGRRMITKRAAALRPLPSCGFGSWQGAFARWQKTATEARCSWAKAASSKMRRKEFEKKLVKLQVELTSWQTGSKPRGTHHRGLRGPGHGRQGRRDQPDHRPHEPRVYRHVALAAPSDREKTQVYAALHRAFPGGGQIVLFDRSWYNRAEIERVMGFCTEEESSGFCW